MTFEHEIERRARNINERQFNRVASNIVASIDQDKDLNEDMSKISNIFFFGSQRDDERQRRSQRRSQSVRDRLTTQSQLVVNRLSIYSRNSFNLSQRSNSFFSITQSLRQDMFENFIAHTMQNRMLQMNLKIKEQELRLKRAKANRVKLKNQQLKINLQQRE